MPVIEVAVSITVTGFYACGCFLFLSFFFVVRAFVVVNFAKPQQRSEIE